MRMWLFCSLLLVLFSKSYGKRSYFGIAQKLDGFHAEEYCKNQFSSNLATITSAQENEDAHKACIAVDPSGECYIGLRRDSQFQQWYFTENNNPDYDRSGYTNWNSLCGLFSGLNNGRWDEEYCDAPVNENSFVCNLNRNKPQQYCGVQFEAWYQADTFDKDSKIFPDLSGNGHEGKVFAGTTFDKKDGDDGLNGHSIVIGAPADKIQFGPNNLPAGPSTVFHVTKYNGATKRRIIEGGGGNWIGGFHGAKSGVYYEWGHWVASHTDRFQSEWVISSIEPALYRGNGKDCTTQSYKDSYNDGNGAKTPYENALGELRINGYNGETSHFAFAELIIVKGINLDSNKLDCIEDYLSHKYGIDVESTYDPDTRSAHTSPVFYDNFNKDQGKIKQPNGLHYVYYHVASNYIIYIIAVLLIVNIICITRYYCYFNKDKKIKYKTVSIDSSSDVDV